MTDSSDWKGRAVTPHEAVALIRSNSGIFVQGAAASPTTLLGALAERRDLSELRLYHLHLEGEFKFCLAAVRREC